MDDVEAKFRLANARGEAAAAAMAQLSVSTTPGKRRPQRTSEYARALRSGVSELVALFGLTPAREPRVLAWLVLGISAFAPVLDPWRLSQQQPI